MSAPRARVTGNHLLQRAGMMAKPRLIQPFYASAPARSIADAKRASESPSYPSVSLRELIPNPKMRAGFYAALGVLACIEGAAYIKFWPKITGRDGAEEGGEGRGEE